MYRTTCTVEIIVYINIVNIAMKRPPKWNRSVTRIKSQYNSHDNNYYDNTENVVMRVPMFINVGVAVRSEFRSIQIT